MKISYYFLLMVSGTALLCMEREEGDRPEKSSYEQQLEQIHKERAAQFAHQQEEAKKEAAREKGKKVKESKTTEKEAKGKEEKVRGPLLTPDEQDKLFNEAKKAIAEEREKQQRIKTGPAIIESPEKAQQQAPKSLVEFLRNNMQSLTSNNPDRELLSQVISWINNNEVNIYEGGPGALIKILLWMMGSQGLTPEILYAVWKNPRSLIFTKVGSDAPAVLSIELLFFPFELRNVLEDWAFSPKANSIINLMDELKAIRATKNKISYLATTKNLNLIRAILFLAQYGWNFTDSTMQEFNANVPAKLTGNEMAPDGTTALMFAVGGGYLELVRELLQQGANPFLSNNRGDNALSIVEVQRQRALYDQDFEGMKIYKSIAQLLEKSVKKRATDIARAIRILMLARVVENSDGTRAVVPGLPYEFALSIALADINEHEQQRILPYLEQLTEEELVIPEMPVEPVTTATMLNQLRSYMSTWAVATLGYYLARSNPS
jgi:hypothetical protein